MTNEWIGRIGLSVATGWHRVLSTVLAETGSQHVITADTDHQMGSDRPREMVTTR
jgi:hypothetical protein